MITSLDSIPYRYALLDEAECNDPATKIQTNPHNFADVASNLSLAKLQTLTGLLGGALAAGSMGVVISTAPKWTERPYVEMEDTFQLGSEKIPDFDAYISQITQEDARRTARQANTDLPSAPIPAATPAPPKLIAESPQPEALPAEPPVAIKPKPPDIVVVQ